MWDNKSPGRGNEAAAGENKQMTYETARTAILARSEIQIKTDKKGREFAQYFSRAAHRWIRIGTDEARMALAAQG